MQPVFAFFSPGPMEMLVIGVIAVLLFGKRLPEVGRSLGKGLVEFKKGIRGIGDEFDLDSPSSGSPAPSVSSSTNGTTGDAADDHEEATAPKFEPPKFEPPTGEPKSDPA